MLHTGSIGITRVIFTGTSLAQFDLQTGARIHVDALHHRAAGLHGRAQSGQIPDDEHHDEVVARRHLLETEFTLRIARALDHELVIARRIGRELRRIVFEEDLAGVVVAVGAEYALAR